MKGVQIDRSGITRTVVLIGPFAVKVPCVRYGGQRWRCFLRGLLANMQERDIGRLEWSQLCPVLFALPGGFLIVMRRARVMTEAEFAVFDAESFVRVGESIIPAETTKADSFGWIDGRVVAIDYGGFAN